MNNTKKPIIFAASRKLTRLTVGGVVLASLASIGCRARTDQVVDACADLESGHACTWMGTPGEEGFNGDGMHRAETQLNQPVDMLFLSDGTPWVTDFNNFLLRRVRDDETVETMVGWTDPLFPGDGPFGGIPPGGGAGEEWQLNHPTNLLEDEDGGLLVVGWHNHKLLHVNADDGYVTVVCGGGAGFAGDGMPVGGTTLFRQPVDASFDEDGNLYVVDQGNGRVRKIGSDDMLSTIAGVGTLGYSGDGGPALEAQFSWARGSNPNPSGAIQYHEGKLYISDTENHAIRVMDLESGELDAFAGTGEEGDSGDDGPALEALLNAPRDLEIGPDGDLYFADTDNGKVRAIDLDSLEIRTVVGTGALGLDEQEGLLATETQLRRPFGIAFDPEGNLFVMDTLNFRIVKVAQ